MHECSRVDITPCLLSNLPYMLGYPRIPEVEHPHLQTRLLLFYRAYEHCLMIISCTNGRVIRRWHCTVFFAIRLCNHAKLADQWTPLFRLLLVIQQALSHLRSLINTVIYLSVSSCLTHSLRSLSQDFDAYERQYPSRSLPTHETAANTTDAVWSL